MDTSGLPIRDGHAVNIPTEIIDEILDYLRSDKSWLQSCALVSTYWTPSCRRHIFGHVTFEGPSDLMKWANSISTAPNGPHLYTRKLTISNRHLETDCYQLPESPRFLQHISLFHNLQDLTIECPNHQQTIDKISPSEVFGPLLGTVQSLSIRGAFCSPQALISLIASFQNLQRLDLEEIWFSTSEIPRILPERRTFKGAFHWADWDDSSEEFVCLLAEHDLQFHEMLVNGEYWLQDTTWNRCLAKCADNLRSFGILWSENSCFPASQCKALNFRNLESLSIRSSSECTTVLPPPEFLSSITSTQLSEITIDTTVFPPGDELDEALNAIRGLDEALCKLTDQLDPSSSGSEKLVLTLRVVEELPDLAAVLPRFNKSGTLKMEAMGM